MRLILFLIGISLTLASSGQKEKNFPGNWRNQPSGELKLTDSEYQSYKKGLVLYYISNDNENLYLDLKIKETIEQTKLLKVGMNIWICMNGKSQKKTGIRYPIGSDYSGGRRGYSNQVNAPTPLSQAHTIQLIGFKDVEPSRFSADNTDNFRGKAWYNDGGDLLYSLVIPLAKISQLDESQDKTGIITLGIEYGVPPEMGAGGPPSGGAPPSGAPRGGGGGRPGGGGGQPGAPSGMGGPPTSSSGSQSLGSPVLFWVKDIALAKK
jgi:hypothetical protein